MERKRIDYKDLTEILKELDSSLASYKNVRLVAIGGTALNLMRLKRSTADVDFVLENNDPILKADILLYLEKQGYSGHIQDRGTIVSYNLPEDYLAKAKKTYGINRNLKHIELLVMNPIDLIISKLARYNTADKQDITQLLNHFNPSWRKIKQRFNQFYDRFQGNKANLQFKFELFSSLFKELKRKKK